MSGISYYEVRVRNRAGTQVAFASSSGGTNPVFDGEFVLERDTGCRELKLTIDRTAFQGTIATGNLIEFWAKPTGGTLTRYYRGKIITAPADGSIYSRGQIVAEGLWFDLQQQMVVKFYTGAAMNTVVADLLDDLDNDSDLDSSTSEISLSSPYTIADFEADYLNAAAAIALLAGVQTDVQYGVDQDGKLYFKDLDTSDVAHFWVGVHMQEFSVVEDGSRLVNRYYAQGKDVVAGGPLTIYREDSTSITNNGLRERLIQIPHLRETDDVWRFLGYLLDQNGIKTLATAKPSEFSDFIFPRGNARITDTDGTEYSLPIQRVVYKIDPTLGFYGTMEVGDEPTPSYDRELAAILQEEATSRSAAISVSKIDHSRGDEFLQACIVDARKNGLLNIFTKEIVDEKSFDFGDDSYNVQTADGGYAYGPFDGTKTRIVTLPINTGRDVDSVRLYRLIDRKGRVDFQHRGDVEATFCANASTPLTGTVADYRIELDRAAMERYATAAAGYLRFGPTPDNLGWVLPTVGTTKAGILWRTGTAVPFNIYYWFGGSTNYNTVVLTNGASNMSVQTAHNHGGGYTVDETYNATKDADYIVEVNCQYGTNAVAKLYDSSGSLIHTFSGVTVPAASSPRIIVSAGGTAQAWSLDFIEFDKNNGDKPDFRVSRDDGTTWTAAGSWINFGYVPSPSNLQVEYKDVNISSQPSGTALRLRLDISAPQRVYAYAIAF